MEKRSCAGSQPHGVMAALVMAPGGLPHGFLVFYVGSDSAPVRLKACRVLGSVKFPIQFASSALRAIFSKFRMVLETLETKNF